jgi:hypothetical protein
MKPKLILCLALVLSGGLCGCSTNAQHSGQTASSSLTNDVSWWNALDEIDRHYWLWETNTSIPPRLSKVVLAIYPCLTNGYANPQPKDIAGWFYPIIILGETHDTVTVSVLRPYLNGNMKPKLILCLALVLSGGFQ